MKGYSYVHCIFSTAVVLMIVETGGVVLGNSQVFAKQSDPTAPSQAVRPGSILTVDEQALQFLDKGVNKALVGDYQGAIQNYNQAIQLGSENGKIYYNRGVALHSLGQVEAALQDFSRAIKLEPTMAEAYSNRGAIRLEQQDRQGAIQDFQYATELFSQQGDTRAAQELQSWMRQNLPSEFGY